MYIRINMVYCKRLAEIAKPYDIEYNKDFDAWQRKPKPDMLGQYGRKFEIGKITELMVGENIMLNKINYVRFADKDLILEEAEGQVLVCICGEDSCHSLSKLYHSGTDTAFLVGSKCITLAEGQEDYINLKKCGIKNGLCEECKIPIVFKGKNKNTTKNYGTIKISSITPHYDVVNSYKLCDKCIDTLYTKLQTRILEKEKKEREEKKAREEAERAKRLEYEIIRKDPKNKHLLNISFAEKDKYREFGTEWDAKLKKWYWVGLIDKIPDEIKKFLIK